MFDFFLKNIYLIVLLPLAVSVLILFYSGLNILKCKKTTLSLTLLSSFVGIIFSIIALITCIKNPNFILENAFTWIKLGDAKIALEAGILVDNLSALLCFIVTSISFLVQLFSFGYMQKDEKFDKYYALLNFFNFSMLGLVLSSNLIQTYCFWELVGVSSYLLIGFWSAKQIATNAAKKAFWVNRIGDVGLLFGIIMLIYYAYNFDIMQGLGLLSFVNVDFWANAINGLSDAGVFYIITVLLLMGSIAKSAQFPLHVWLEDAMQGPTPVSALIHAATMVAAGVYLIARLYPLYASSPMTMNTIMFVGIFTAFFAAIAAIGQNDIKKILAFSTCSQLGLMFFAMGIGAYSGGLMHLFTHAYFKALLFLSVGMVLACIFHVQDIRRLGGLRKQLPVAAVSFLIGAVSISGLGFGGFVSKDTIFEAAFNNYPLIVFLFLPILGFLSSFYIFRAYFGIFEGEQRSIILVEKPDKTMSLSLIVLSILVIVTGLGVLTHFNEFIFSEVAKGVEQAKAHAALIVTSSSFIAGCLGILFAFYRYKMGEFLYSEKKNSFLKQLICQKFYVNEFYEFLVCKVLAKVAKLLALFDKYFVDGFVLSCGKAVKRGSDGVSKLQNGNVQTYLTYSAGIVAMLLLVLVLVYYQMMKV